MLREYLEVAHHAISAQEEIYQVKEQRLLLAQQEYQLLHDTWRNKSTSQTSCKETLTHSLTHSLASWRHRQIKIDSGFSELRLSVVSLSLSVVNSRSSSSSRYDPEILKAEIITAKSRVRDDKCINRNRSPILGNNPYC